eukprot:scaffold301117_cov30-Tisochrysis_lutea.AAC.1
MRVAFKCWERELADGHPHATPRAGASDHLPVIGTFEVVGYKSGRMYDVRMNSEMFDSQEVRKVVSHL